MDPWNRPSQVLRIRAAAPLSNMAEKTQKTEFEKKQTKQKNVKQDVMRLISRAVFFFFVCVISCYFLYASDVVSIDLSTIAKRSKMNRFFWVMKCRVKDASLTFGVVMCQVSVVTGRWRMWGNVIVFLVSARTQTKYIPLVMRRHFQHVPFRLHPYILRPFCCGCFRYLHRRIYQPFSLYETNDCWNTVTTSVW